MSSLENVGFQSKCIHFRVSKETWEFRDNFYIVFDTMWHFSWTQLLQYSSVNVYNIENAWSWNFQKVVCTIFISSKLTEILQIFSIFTNLKIYLRFFTWVANLPCIKYQKSKTTFQSFLNSHVYFLCVQMGFVPS